MYVSKTMISLYEWVHEINKTDKYCDKYCQTIANSTLKLYKVRLSECKVINRVLFKTNLLWVLKDLYTEVLQEVHNSSSSNYLNINKTVDLIHWHCY